LSKFSKVQYRIHIHVNGLVVTDLRLQVPVHILQLKNGSDLAHQTRAKFLYLAHQYAGT